MVSIVEKLVAAKDKVPKDALDVPGLIRAATDAIALIGAPNFELNMRGRDNGDFTNQNATQPETSPEVICKQSASLRMLGAKLQRVFFKVRTRGWHLQRFQKT